MISLLIGLVAGIIIGALGVITWALCAAEKDNEDKE
jgi:uncharacterized membrane-anchored protein YhcB (DUF1043 family)